MFRGIPDPIDQLLPIHPTEPSLQETLLLPKETHNLHEDLTQILEKFKLDVDNYEDIIPKDDKYNISDFQDELSRLKNEITHSKKLVFNLNSLEKKYHLVVPIIRKKICIKKIHTDQTIK